MKKLLLLVALSTMGILMFASVASAQSVGSSASASGGVFDSGCNPKIAPGCGRDVFSAGSGSASGTVFDGGGLQAPVTGGPAFMLPAAALLLGSGILTYAILRRG